jgi:hypothetical protein
MGGKSGYSRVIAELLGLSRLNPPSAYVWGDVGPNIAALACLFGAAGSAEEVARWLHANALSMVKDGTAGSYSRVNGEGNLWVSKAGKEERWQPTTVESTAWKAEIIPSPRAPEVAAIIRGWRDEEPRALWTRLKAAGWPSLLLPKGSGGRWLGPQSVEEVAAFLLAVRWSFNEKGPEHGYGGPGRPVNTINANWTMEDRDKALSIERFTGILESNKSAPRVACWQGRAEDMRLPERLDGWIMYMDPPYENTTGYKHGGCPRETVLRLALDWSARGATVAISEAVRLDDALPGWYAVQIDGERVGQKRTFSKQQSEWVTMNRKPVVVPGVQASLWGTP